MAEIQDEDGEKEREDRLLAGHCSRTSMRMGEKGTQGPNEGSHVESDSWSENQIFLFKILFFKSPQRKLHQHQLLLR